MDIFKFQDQYAKELKYPNIYGKYNTFWCCNSYKPEFLFVFITILCILSPYAWVINNIRSTPSDH